MCVAGIDRDVMMLDCMCADIDWMNVSKYREREYTDYKVNVFSLDFILNPVGFIYFSPTVHIEESNY